MTSAASTPVLIKPQVIVGLGNPGAKYEQTRHNIGFMAIDALARSWQISLAEHRKFQGLFGEGNGPQSTRIRLLKPQTFMNASGQSIRAVLDWFKLPPESVLVIYDDMDLPLGKIRLRLSGSAGGHNGVKSTISHLGTQNFPRLRIGIGHSVKNGEKDTISHVLGHFSGLESKFLPDVLQLVSDTVDLGLRQGLEKAMSLYNSRSIEMPTE